MTGSKFLLDIFALLALGAWAALAFCFAHLVATTLAYVRAYHNAWPDGIANDVTNLRLDVNQIASEVHADRRRSSSGALIARLAKKAECRIVRCVLSRHDGRTSRAESAKQCEAVAAALDEPLASALDYLGRTATAAGALGTTVCIASALFRLAVDHTGLPLADFAQALLTTSAGAVIVLGSKAVGHFIARPIRRGVEAELLDGIARLIEEAKQRLPRRIPAPGRVVQPEPPPAAPASPSTCPTAERFGVSRANGNDGGNGVRPLPRRAEEVSDEA